MTIKYVGLYPKNDYEAKIYCDVTKTYFENGFFVIEIGSRKIRYAIEDIYKIDEFQSND